MRRLPLILVTLGALAVAATAGALAAQWPRSEWHGRALANRTVSATQLEGFRRFHWRAVAWGEQRMEPGECVVVVRAVDDPGRLTTAPPVEVRSTQSLHFRVEEACADDASEDSRGLVAFVDGELFRVARAGDVPDHLGITVALEARYQAEAWREDRPSILLTSLFTFLVAMGAGLGYVSRRADPPSPDVCTVRRIVLAVAGELRGPLQDLLRGHETDLEGVRAARDLLAAHPEAIGSACWQRWRDAGKVMDARWAACWPDPPAPTTSRAAYREGGTGWVGVEIRIRHGCELPPMPRGASHVSDALLSSIPADDREVLAIEARLSPADPTARFDDAALRARWPELVAIDATGLQPCEACEALCLGRACLACGADA